MPDVVIAFFALGLFAGVLKSDLKVPDSVYQILSIVLMLVLGLKGGQALHGKFSLEMLGTLLPVMALGVVAPLLCYPVLRRLVRLPIDDAASIAAHYGSVSAGTFAVALAMAEQSGAPLLPETTLFLVVLELPAIILMLWLQRRLSGSQNRHSVLAEALTSRSVVLLAGGVLIGYLYGPAGLAPLQAVLLDGFKTMLAIFLLEMGLCTARVCVPLPWQHWRLMTFAALAPFALAWLGIGTAVALGLPQGSALVLAALTASASYIAAPAAIQASIPTANIGLAMLAALGITFPVNVLVGLPLYQQWVQRLYA